MHRQGLAPTQGTLIIKCLCPLQSNGNKSSVWTDIKSHCGGLQIALKNMNNIIMSSSVCLASPSITLQLLFHFHFRFLRY